MKFVTGLLWLLLVSVGLTLTSAPVQAIGTGAPVVTNPAAGSTLEVGLSEVTVDFSDAPVGRWTIAVVDSGGSVLYSLIYDFDGSSPTAALGVGSLASPGDYVARVSADDGAVVAENPFTVIPEPGPPSAPTDTYATSRTHEGTLAWNPPADDGGSPVTGYQVQRGSSAASRRNLSTSARSVSFLDLTNGTTYKLYVRAQNAVGFGPWAHSAVTPFQPARRPSTPSSPDADPRSHGATLSWSYRAGDNGGTALLGYEVQVGHSAATRRGLAPSTRSHAFRGLTNGRTYSLYVRSRNAVGFSPWASAAATPVGRPSAPTLVRATASSHRATLYWGPGANGGAEITRYQVQRGSNGATRRNLDATVRSRAFTHLTNGTTYTLYVRAHNRVGYGPWRHASARPHGATPPAGPAPKEYANCDALHRAYPHGVGRRGAVDNGGVTNFTRDNATYNLNTKSDRDHDGIACEQ